jgi:hypothetical protein
MQEIAMKTMMLAAAAVMSLGMASAFATTTTQGQVGTRVAQLNLDMQTSPAAKMLPDQAATTPGVHWFTRPSSVPATPLGALEAYASDAAGG